MPDVRLPCLRQLVPPVVAASRAMIGRFPERHDFMMLRPPASLSSAHIIIAAPGACRRSGGRGSFPRMKRSTPPDSPALFDLFETGPDFSIELEAQKAGFGPVAGTDEAGRGPLAGPVVAAAVILDPDNIPTGLNDSKQLSKAKRERLFEAILKTSIVSIASSGPALIDDMNILRASLDAMRRAVLGLDIPPAMVLADGRDKPPGIPCAAKAVIRGDARSVSIAAASIIAKVTRDRMMDTAGKLFPAYGFSGHAGYGTAAHRAAIEMFGPCPLHRMSFRPLRKD
jgi:ribonuclease HII